MKIKIENKNKEKLEAALKEVNGKATSLTVTSLTELLAVVERAERKIHMIPKKDQVGIAVTYRPCGPSKSYKWQSATTCIKVERFPSGWFLVEADRAEIWPIAKEVFQVAVSPDQAEIIRIAAMQGFTTERK